MLFFFKHSGLDFKIFLFITAFGLLGSCQGLAQDSESKTLLAKRLVERALDAELRGDAGERNRLLNRAVVLDPAYEPARWHMGQVRTDENEWVTLDEAEDSASNDANLNEYLSLRNSKIEKPKGNEVVAEWCRRKGMEKRAKAHWGEVLRETPGHRKAIGRLGLRLHHGRWLTREQISAMKERQRNVARVQSKWRSKISSWKKSYPRKSDEEKQVIHREISEIARPELVRLFETELTPVDERLGVAVIKAIDSISNQAATESLLRHAVKSKWGAVRSAATESLKNRSPHGYVPILIDAMMAPLEFQSWNVHSAIDDSQVVGMSYTIAQEGKHVDRMIRGSIDFVGSGDMENADDARDDILERVEEENKARERFNRPLGQVLRSTTGQSFEADPTVWNRWWNDFNEYQVPEFRPVETSFRRASRVVVASRPFSCFPAGTLVSTERGRKPIEEIRVGDLVLSKNAVSGELRYQPVLQTTVRVSDSILELSMNDEVLRVTRGHPMWVNGRQWQMAKQLQPGSQLHGAIGPVEVRWLRDARMKAKVYNLVVDEFHTYFVGESRVLVHDNSHYTPPGVEIPGR